MFKTDLSRFARADAPAGFARQWAVAAAHGVEQSRPDNVSCAGAPDVVADGIGYSVKASDFSLMSPGLSRGATEFEAIWEIFTEIDRADRYVYVTREWMAYEMDLTEFSEFVHKFGYLSGDSKTPGLKIKCLRESKKMLRWLEAKA
jgi:hypothetical protein